MAKRLDSTLNIGHKLQVRTPPTVAFWMSLAIVALTMSLGLTRCKTAWFDETAYAAPAIDWCQHDQMRLVNYPNVASAKATLFIVHPLLLGTFFKLFGIGLVQSRAFVLLCYLLLLAVCHRLFSAWKLPSYAAWMGVLTLAVDPAIVWQVRSGRPDMLPILLTAITAWVLTLCYQWPTRVGRRCLACVGGALAALVPITHPYAVPGLSVVVLAWLLATFRGGDRRESLASTLFLIGGGMLALAILFVCFFPPLPDLLAGMAIGNAYLAENREAGLGVPRRILIEITRRWARGSFIEPIRWLFLLVGFPLAARSHRMLVSICVCWLLVLFAFLAIWVPKNTWYQTAYAALPMAGLIAAVADAIGEAGASRRIILPLLWVTSFALGFALLVLYPVAAIQQWQLRSHDLLKQKLIELIPPGSVVACDPGAYFANIENGCTTYYSYLKLRGLDHDPVLSNAYQKGLISQSGVRYFVINREIFPEVLQGAVFLGTTGMLKQASWFVQDPSYDFDVYEIRNAESAPEGARP